MSDGKIALDEVSNATNEELIARLRRLARADQTLNARLLVHLGEVEARGLYRDQAYSSMFAYCVEELRMFENQAYLRIQVARLARQFPLVLQLLAQGELSLTAIKQLAPHLTPDNHERLLERARGKHTREIALLIAAIAPKPDVSTRMRKLPEPSTRQAIPHEAQLIVTSIETQASCTLESPAPSPIDARQPSLVHARANALPEVCGSDRAPCLDNRETLRALDASDAPRGGASDSSGAQFALEVPRPRGSSKPLSPGRYKVEFTAGQALHDKLVQLQELLRHQVPDGDLAVIVERAVDQFLDNTLKQRFAQTRTPQKPRSAQPRKANSRYVPRAVVREVHQRDAGQCTFLSAEGKRCSERGFLELHHHDQPYARGGKSTVENLRLVCRAHNALFAERDFGATFMRSKRTQAREPSSERVAKRVQL